jgi:hypothetical protein
LEDLAPRRRDEIADGGDVAVGVDRVGEILHGGRPRHQPRARLIVLVILRGEIEVVAVGKRRQRPEGRIGRSRDDRHRHRGRVGGRRHICNSPHGVAGVGDDAA